MSFQKVGPNLVRLKSKWLILIESGVPNRIDTVYSYTEQKQALTSSNHSHLSLVNGGVSQRSQIQTKAIRGSWRHTIGPKAVRPLEPGSIKIENSASSQMATHFAHNIQKIGSCKDSPARVQGQG